MNPDRRIVNPALLGQQSLQDIDLYINPITGNDSNNGLTASTAKQTVQAAWNSLPTLIRTTATLNLADGTYYESVKLSGKTAQGNAVILIKGNTASPDSVVMTGEEQSTPGVAVGTNGFYCDNQKYVVIEGIKFQYYISSGMQATFFSDIVVRNCKATKCLFGFNSLRHSIVRGESLEVYDGLVSSSRGIVATRNASFIIANSNMHDLASGFLIGSQGLLEAQSITVDNCINGIFAASSYVSITSGGTNTISNCTTGLIGSLNAVISYNNNSTTTYTSNTTNEDLQTGTQRLIGAFATVNFN